VPNPKVCIISLQFSGLKIISNSCLISMRFLIFLPKIHSIKAEPLILNINGVNLMNNIDKIKETASNVEDTIKETTTSAESKLKETAASAEEMARKVWLAGLGAYGKGYEEIKGRIESLSTDSNKLFNELVVKGEKLEAEGKDKVEEVKTKVAAKTEIESRIETVRNKLGLNSTDNDQKIEELSAKIDALTAAVAKLAAKPAAKKA
jgi:polyhydroxyalkanoate synthesis regulator phasin